jgi:hypothetical protein
VAFQAMLAENGSNVFFEIKLGRRVGSKRHHESN